MAIVDRKLSSRSSVESTGDIGVEETISSTEDRSSTATSNTRSTGDQPRYVVEGEFARGGLGRILKAHDARLERPVALKELLTSNAVVLERFQREVAITARLQHPAIVPVYDSGTWDGGDPYYVMKLLTEARTLKEVVADCSDLDKRLALLPNVIAVADAIAYAHSQQIIHRDLKPSNVLVGSFGETVVIDWGLAKDLARPAQPEDIEGAPYRAGSPELTTAGSILGTPQYMAPEQARGQNVGKRADVYSLGAVLYHVLKGQPPYRGKDAAEVIGLVLKQAPPRLADVQPGVPPDLDAIVAKAMARDPEARYKDAEEFVADLRRFQTGQLVNAHAYSNRQLFSRWLSRHRTPVAISALFTLAFLVAGTAGLREIVRERDRARARAHELILTQARSQLGQDPTAAVAWAKTYPPEGADWAGVHDIMAEAESQGVAKHVFRRSSTFYSQSAFSHDGTKIATEVEPSVIRISDVETGRVIARVPHGGITLGMAWADDDRSILVSNWTRAATSPLELIELANGAICNLASVKRNTQSIEIRGAKAITAGGEGTVWLWDLSKRTGRPIILARSKIYGAHFSPDGETVAAAGADGVIRVFSTDTNQLKTLPAGSSVIRFQFTPDGRALISGQQDGSVSRWDLITGKRQSIGRQDGRIAAVAVSSDGTWVATGSEDNTVHLRNLRDSSSRVLAGHAGPVYTIAFSADNKFLATGSSDTTIRVWGLESGVARTLRGHTASVQGLAFSRDSRFLLSTAEDKTTRVWDTRDLLRESALSGHQRRVVQIAFSSDGRHLASAGLDQTVRLWSFPSGHSEGVHELTQNSIAMAYSPDGSRLATGGDRYVVVWDAHSGRELLHEQLLPGSSTWALQFSPDGERLAVSTDTGIIYLFEKGERTFLRGHAGPVRSIAFSPDGGSLASGGDDRVVLIWDLHGGAPHRVVQTHRDHITGVGFSADGQTVVSSSFDGTIRLTNLRSGTDRMLMRLEPLSLLTLSRAGKWLASAAGSDGVVVLWDLSTGRCRLLRGHTGKVTSLDFSPDERLLLSSGYDKSVRLWDTASGEISRVNRTDGYVHSSRFSPDGRRYALGVEDGTVRFWSIPNSMPPTTPPQIRHALDLITTSTLNGSPLLLQTQ